MEKWWGNNQFSSGGPLRLTCLDATDEAAVGCNLGLGRITWHVGHPPAQPIPKGMDVHELLLTMADRVPELGLNHLRLLESAVRHSLQRLGVAQQLVGEVAHTDHTEFHPVGQSAQPLGDPDIGHLGGPPRYWLNTKFNQGSYSARVFFMRQL